MSIIPSVQLGIPLAGAEGHELEDTSVCRDSITRQLRGEELPIIVTMGQRGVIVRSITPVTPCSDSEEFVRDAVSRVKEDGRQQTLSDMGPQILHGSHHGSKKHGEKKTHKGDYSPA